MTFFKRPASQTSFPFPIYLFAVLTVLTAVLVVNGFFEIKRTRDRLFDILEAEALVVIRGVEKNAGNLMALLPQYFAQPSSSLTSERAEDFLGIEDLLIERMITWALDWDRKGGPPQPPSKDFEIHGVYFLDEEGRPSGGKTLPGPLASGSPFFREVIRGASRLAVFRGEGSLRQEIPLALAVARSQGKGVILLVLSPAEYLKLSRQVILQNFLEDFSGKGNIIYLEVEDEKGTVLAQTGESYPSGQSLERIKKESGTKGTEVFWVQGEKEELLEVLQPFRPGGKSLGKIRVGLTLKQVYPILSQSRRNILLMGAILFGLGVVSLFTIFRLQKRNFQKIREMEGQMRLKEELSAMGQLAAGVAHEIKNPLNAISLVVQRLEREFVPADSESREEYTRFIRIVGSEISRVNRIIGDFLLLAKPIKMRREDHSLWDILNYCLDLLEGELQKRGVRLVKEGEEDIPPLTGDRFQLTQAFLNIFNNALEAMPDGGVLRVRVSPMNAAVGRRSTAGGKKDQKSVIEIRVSDSGPGIPSEDLKKIFAPYYTTKEKGLGLGLAITRRMIQAHGGEVDVDSVVGQGTTVIVRLPLTGPLEPPKSQEE